MTPMLLDDRLAPDSPTPPPSIASDSRIGATDRFSAWMLSGPMTRVLAIILLFQLFSWLPHYLTWPYWADHDVFANAARAWSQGKLPYQGTLGNNFPGTIYLFLGLGTLFGWGRPWVWQAFDAGLILTFGLVLILWSRRRFGGALPGVSGFLVLTSYLFGLDYCHAGQRDWQGPALACLAILLAQGWPGFASRVGAGVLAAAAFAIRPQTLLFWPGLFLAVDPSESGRRGRNFLETAGALGLGLIAAFAPLALAGVLDDCLRSVSLTAYGGTYNQVTPAKILKGWFLQLAGLRWLALLSVLVLLARPYASRATRTALPWLWVFVGVSLYKPLSPVAHSYLNIPLEVVGAVVSAVVVGLVVNGQGVQPAFRLAGVLLVLGLGGSTIRPDFCVAGPTVRALAGWARGTVPVGTPPGYRRGTVATSAYYPWSDYQAMLAYLRARTSPTTGVANVLKGDPAVLGMVDRPSALPAESLAWLRMVRPGDEGRFAEALRGAGDSVVVWSPGEVGPHPAFRVVLLTEVIEELYEPEARFGVIEVWRRRGSRGAGAPSAKP